jgi:hypothetical protein
MVWYVNHLSHLDHALTHTLTDGNDAQIKVKGDAAISGYTETGLEFSDGSKLNADVIVFCTGFSHDVRGEAIKIVGPELGEQLDDYWELDDEGELRGAYKPHGGKSAALTPMQARPILTGYDSARCVVHWVCELLVLSIALADP